MNQKLDKQQKIKHLVEMIYDCWESAERSFSAGHEHRHAAVGYLRNMRTYMEELKNISPSDYKIVKADIDNKVNQSINSTKWAIGLGLAGAGILALFAWMNNSEQ